MTKAITVCQPYAALIAAGEKRVENRTWPTRYRGPLLIHAGKSQAWLKSFDGPVPMLVFGAIVAEADLVACFSVAAISRGKVPTRYRELASHAHTEGPYCWVLENVSPLAEPVPYRGQQGLFDVPEAVLTQRMKERTLF
jgi:hypothetical protein